VQQDTIYYSILSGRIFAMYRKLYRAILCDKTSEKEIVAGPSEPILPDDSPLDSLIPRCYLTKVEGKAEDKMERFSEGTLFFIFYNHVGEKVQRDAYKRLVKMGWIHSKAIGGFFQVVGREGDRGEVLVFDHKSWRKVYRDVELDRRFAESAEPLERE
jgi:CCR4-NOT transcriptional regulation complex NOT5 subunit